MDNEAVCAISVEPFRVDEGIYQLVCVSLPADTGSYEGVLVFAHVTTWGIFGYPVPERLHNSHGVQPWDGESFCEIVHFWMIGGSPFHAATLLFVMYSAIWCPAAPFMTISVV